MRSHPWCITPIRAEDIVPGTEDQIVMQCSNHACNLFFGDYDRSKIIIKSRLMSPRQHNPVKYRLAVPVAERFEDHRYLVGVADRLEPIIFFRLTGWAWGSDLPDKPEPSGPFKGSFCIPGLELRSIWEFFD